MSPPSVTAVIATRDRPELLERAVRAILDQSYEGRLECLVVFDQQSPATPQVAVPEGRELRVCSNERSPGLAGARNTGGLAASGDLLAFCDDDDEWLPDKLRLQVEALQADATAAVATCGIFVCTPRRTFRRLPEQPRVDRAQLLRSRQMWLHSSTLVFWRDRFLGDIGMIDEAIPGSYGEDYEWVLRAAAAAPIVAVPKPLVRVFWASSWYNDRWDVMSVALQYHLEKHPELAHDPGNAARLYGRIAFANAAAGRKVEAWRWIKRSLRLDWRQPRGYLAMLVSAGVLRPKLVQKVAHSVGRGL